MSGIRPWQIVILVLAVVALIASIAFTASGDDSVDFADSVLLVDLETGELIDAPYPSGKSISLPAINPATSKRSLFPVEKTDGQWRVEARYLSMVKEFVPKPEALTDPKAGTVKVANESPKSVKVF
ncbi:MAG: hypothetical protein SFY69_00360 [Planctomycetota bacterium]|nr:hypothetical protein [Planctomycetota bacterium]